MRYIAVIFLLCSFISQASDKEEVRIGIYRDINLSATRISAMSGKLTFYPDTLAPFEISGSAYVNITVVGNRCKLVKNNGTTVFCDTLLVNRDGYDTGFEIKPVIPSYRSRKYQGNLFLTVENERYLKVINEVPLHFYLAGVLESEGGAYQSLEYYKVQAIISRTYALKNKHKHLSEGFMLTDLVNCQVYKSMCRYDKKIYDAVKETDGLVIVDQNLSLITASFYSNSGGQTSNSEDVWNEPLPYLRSVYDPFSEGMPNHKWTKTISKAAWLDYLKNTFQYPTTDPVLKKQALNYDPFNRSAFFLDQAYGIPMRDIRYDWKLKSAYFSVKEKGSVVVLSGKGFGHGVGLSQEGAMNMVKRGYDFKQVIHYYFTNVEIMSYDMYVFYISDRYTTIAVE